MKAFLRHRYGSPDVIELAEIEQPTVDDDGVLVRVRAASVNAYDWHVLRGKPYLVRTSEGLRRPKQAAVGVDLAGEVVAVGRNVTEFKVGDAVFGERGGAFAEYVCAREAGLAIKPANLSFEEAAAVPMAGFTALQGLRDKGAIKAGQHVLITGAAGGVGTFAVQLAKAFGAEVTAVCATQHVEMVRSIGADHVIDYTREDFTRGGRRYDLILDVAASQSLRACRKALRPQGVLVVVGAPKGNWLAPVLHIVAAVVLSRLGSQRLLPFLAERRQADLIALKDLIEAGAVHPVIDRTYPFDETAAAIRHIETGHPGGKVVISI
jgi:NADPH:quinone reductase-like Zn-dependent oxidoreductase